MRSFVMALVMLGVAGCTSSPKSIEFCSIGSGSAEARDSLVLNTRDRTLKRAGALYQYALLESEVARGFVAPFPFALPKHPPLLKGSSLSTGETLQWEFDGYSFSVSPFAQGDPDWVLINSQPVDDGKSQATEIVWHTSVLYSVSDGVLAIRTVSQHGEERSASAAFSCGAAPLHASNF